MTYENSKTMILTFLILLSGILTWNIWTYQPNYESIEDPKTLNPVNLAMKRELRKIVKPHQVIYHVEGKQYGTAENSHIDKLINTMSKWKFYDMKKYAGRVADFNERIAANANTEIIFPDEVPIELYKRVLNMDDKDLPKFDFDRIIIHTETPQKQEGIIYFYSQKNQQVYESNVNPSFINEFTAEFYKTAGRLTPYFLHNISEIKRIYLPVEQMEMVKYTYYRNPLDPDKFKEALFNDPSFVQRSVVSEEIEEYMDDATKMTVDLSTNMIYYVNPVRDRESTIGTSNVLQKSIEFVNSHGGWTESYRYVYKDDFNQKVLFRLYSKEGFPVFNQTGLSEIYQQWGTSDISRYIRPGFHLELPLNPDVKTKKLPSGSEALELVKKKKDFKPELFENMMPGYYLLQEPGDSRVILLEPGWFYLYNQQWRQLEGEEGGNKFGLEQN